MAKRKTVKLPEEQWLKMETEYVVSGLSQNEISEKYGVPFSTVRNHADNGEWTRKRAEYQQRVHEMAIEQIADDAADKEASKLITLMTASDQLDTLICSLSAIMAEKAPNVRELRDYTAILKDAIAIKRDLWNIPKEQTEETAVIVRLEGATEGYAN